MAANPSEWAGHYHGSDKEIQFCCKYSFSDRSRYYMGHDIVVNALNKMMKNLNSTDIPLGVISQYMPEQYRKIRNGTLRNDPADLIKDKIKNVLAYYDYAVHPSKH